MHTLYRHFKGRYYQVLGIALDTATETEVVVYRTLYASGYVLYTRPKEEFFGAIRGQEGQLMPRFSPVELAELPADAAERVVPDLPRS